MIMLGLQQIAVDQQWELQREQALRYLRGVSARPEWRGVQVNVAVDMGKPAETILAFAEKHGIGRIVISTHGRTGLGRWVFGSAADKVLRATQTTVLVVRPPVTTSSADKCTSCQKRNTGLSSSASHDGRALRSSPRIAKSDCAERHLPDKDRLLLSIAGFSARCDILCPRANLR
jgi:Universal stress protein family